MNKIVKSQRAMKRSMLEVGLKDKKQTNWIKNKIKVKDAGQHVARLKWNFTGITLDKGAIAEIPQCNIKDYGN